MLGPCGVEFGEVNLNFSWKEVVVVGFRGYSCGIGLDKSCFELVKSLIIMII